MRKSLQEQRLHANYYNSINTMHRLQTLVHTSISRAGITPEGWQLRYNSYFNTYKNSRHYVNHKTERKKTVGHLSVLYKILDIMSRVFYALLA